MGRLCRNLRSLCRTLLKSLSRPPGLSEGEAVTDRTQSAGGSDGIGPRPQPGHHFPSPSGGVFWSVAFPPDPMAYLHSASHLPPASFRGAHWTQNQHCWAHLPPLGAGLQTGNQTTSEKRGLEPVGASPEQLCLFSLVSLLSWELDLLPSLPAEPSRSCKVILSSLFLILATSSLLPVPQLSPFH